jgi:hypothetical protein
MKKSLVIIMLMLTVSVTIGSDVHNKEPDKNVLAFKEMPSDAVLTALETNVETNKSSDVENESYVFKFASIDTLKDNSIFVAHGIKLRNSWQSKYSNTTSAFINGVRNFSSGGIPLRCK